MADCECLPKCPFFLDKMASKPATSQLMKKQYCLGDSTNCARHMVFKAVGGLKVPVDLYPAQTERVKKIVIEAKKTTKSV